jgi:hypothetical protein
VIAWPDFQTGFASLLTRLSGVPANVVNARDDGANYTFPAGAPYPEPGSTDEGQVKVDFSIVSEMPWGRDEERTVYDPDAVIEGDTYAGPGAPLGGVVYSVNGNRELTIEITCDRFNQSQPAFETLQRIRDKLWLPSTRAACTALGIAVSKSSRILRVDADLDGRSVSRYILEVTANSMSNASDDPITTIESVPADLSGVTA